MHACHAHMSRDFKVLVVQFAGKQLRELEKDMKGMNLGVIFSEGTKRAMRQVKNALRTTKGKPPSKGQLID